MKFPIIFLFFLVIISLTSCSKKTSIANITESHVIVNANVVDSTIYKAINPYKKVHDEQMYIVLAKSEDALIKADVESTLGNFFCDAVLFETKKILGDNSIAVTATAVRVPVVGGHSEAVNIEFENDFDLADVRRLLHNQSGITLKDDPTTNSYPMPKYAEGKDDVFVGRIRRDESQANTLNLWIVADNLRKGAATNAVQIAKLLIEKGLI